ncbi:MAG TPA: hypothetical protein VMN36_11220 [Verrucomicrobiales bacterium]|nr:hypothetical protein [Verrucomicrobiales bacterium]
MGGSDTITAGVSRWFYRRMLIMTLVVLGMGAFFLYDGMVRYPEKGRIYQTHQAWTGYEAERDAFLQTELDDSNWIASAQARPEFQPYSFWEHETWKSYANARGWPEKPPEKDYSKKVTEQFVCAGICFAIVIVLLTVLVLSRSRTLRADGASFTTPAGRRIPFASAHRVDKRKWDNKGLAYVYYDDEGGIRKRATIDCLKYGEGAEQIFDRLMENFDGEVIETAPEQEAEIVVSEPAAEVLPRGQKPGERTS